MIRTNMQFEISTRLEVSAENWSIYRYQVQDELRRRIVRFFHEEGPREVLQLRASRIPMAGGGHVRWESGL